MEGWRKVIPVEAESATTTIAFDPAPVALANSVVVLGHGASSHLDHATISGIAAHLRKVGFHTVRYNFLYTEAKKGPPDRMPKLLNCFRAVVLAVRETLEPQFLLAGGHSMGGRVSSIAASEGDALDGLVLCGYPLHPADQPEKLRREHLPRIQCPVFCANGTRDALCTPSLMDDAVGSLPNWTMHWLEAADHSFHVLKRSGRTDEEVLQEFASAAQAWASRNGLLAK